MTGQPYDRGGYLPPGTVFTYLKAGEEIVTADEFFRRRRLHDEPHHARARLRTDAEAAALAGRETGGDR